MKRGEHHGKKVYSLPAWIGIVAITLQINAVPLDYLLFRINQDYIASSLCEHKMPHCNGHCFLMKQMAKTNASSDKKAARSTSLLDGHYVPVALTNLTLLEITINLSPDFVQPLLSGWDVSFLHPPRIA